MESGSHDLLCTHGMGHLHTHNSVLMAGRQESVAGVDGMAMYFSFSLIFSLHIVYLRRHERDADPVLK